MNEMNAPIQWYPGHMAKARRQLADQIRKTDLVIELCDARLPFSSRNPELNKMVAGKKRILFLNKADLADPNATKAWTAAFRRDGLDAYPIDATRLRNKEILNLIQQATRELIEKALAKGVRKTIRAMVIGVPNVGKSTMINRLYGSGITSTEDRPGVTRSQRWVRINPYLEFLDTPGMLWPRLDDQIAAKRLCYIGSVNDEVVDLYALTISLLEDLSAHCPETLRTRFHLESVEPRGTDLLDAACKGRGWLLKGNRYDYDRACSIILDEFRAGKLGRITLEEPADITEENQLD
ncbi:MAG: ribosome biogenesis GTPase YlqF [Clostridia bacterium]|nr:ribosome biogenesis GTPase YlqF [Clostridia bacterium]